MLTKPSFWKFWPVGYQRLAGILFLVFVAALAITVSAIMEYPAPTYQWQQWQELQRIALPVHQFNISGIPLTISGENYVLLERWATDPIRVNLGALDLYLALFVAGLAVCMACITTLPRISFFIGAGLISYLISELHLDALGLAGFENNYPAAAAILIWVVVAAYFHYFRPDAGFFQRLVTIVVLFAAVGLTMAFTSKATSPFRLLAAHSIPAAMIVLVLFMVVVSHEIISGFLYLATDGSRNKKSARDFFIVTLLYFITLWISYWNKIGWIDWNLPVNPILLFLVSTLVGWWGIRQRTTTLLPSWSEPLTVSLYAGAAIMCMASLGYFFSASHDVALLSVTDMILYTHLGFGIMFVVYILSNFLGPLMQNLPVSRALYRPANMPYFSYILAGGIFTLGFIFYNRWQGPVNHFHSTRYAVLGDVYGESDALLSEGYYKKSLELAPYNQHVAGILAHNESIKGNTLKQEKYLKDANRYKPTPFTYVNATLPYFNSGQRLSELLLLQEAHRQLPESGVIANNLGLCFAQLNLTDSAAWYFAEASRDKHTRTSAEMNMLAVWARQDNRMDPDSVRRRLESEHPHVKVNTLALANRNGREMEMDIPWPADSTLTIFTATLMGNRLTNQVNQPDTALLNRCLSLARKPQNTSFKDVVFVPAAYAAYAASLVSRAVQLLQQVIFDGSQQGVHNTTLGLWALELGKSDVALGSFRFAIDQKSEDAVWLAALSLAEDGQLNESMAGWDSLQRKSKDATVRRRAESMMRVLGGPEKWYPTFTDEEKYLYTHYRVNDRDSTQFITLVSQIGSPQYQALALFSRSKKYFQGDELNASIQTYRKLEGLTLTDESLADEIRRFELRLLAAQGQITSLREASKSFSWGAYHRAEAVYYEALGQWAAGDTLNAGKNLDWLARENPWFDEGVVSAAAFFSRHGTDTRKPYRILSEALQMNPHSVKILKAYIPQAAQSGYDDYVRSSLATLRSLVSEQAYDGYTGTLKF